MTDNERQEIKMIADFMGIRIREWLTCFWTCDEETLGIDPDSGDEVYSPARNWQQLMPVVEKIGKLYEKAFPPHDEFIKRILAHEDPIDKEYIDVISTSINTPINEVYATVVKFIKWYNQQPK